VCALLRLVNGRFRTGGYALRTRSGRRCGERERWPLQGQPPHCENRLLDESGLRTPSGDDEAENEEEENEQERKADDAQHGWIVGHEPSLPPGDARAEISIGSVTSRERGARFRRSPIQLSALRWVGKHGKRSSSPVSPSVNPLTDADAFDSKPSDRAASRISAVVRAYS
jgi:hypothetical protein